jgi:hypothetical protein
MVVTQTSSQVNYLDTLKDHFYKHGWMVVKLPNPEPVYQASLALLSKLQTLTGKPDITLENYHQFIEDDVTHTDIQFTLTQFFWEQELGKKVISAQIEFFKSFLGEDINVQSKPHLRITRPNKPQDNIGYHRDTYYGCLPFEISVLVPYVDLPAESSLSVLSGSHTLAESNFPTTQVENPAVSKGSVKHQLGFLYAPKIIDPSRTIGMESIPLALGEALIFSLATVHGSVENQGNVSRWSSDIRVVNALAPLSPSLKPGYYEKLTRSVVTELADIYNQAQLVNHI